MSDELVSAIRASAQKTGDGETLTITIDTARRLASQNGLPTLEVEVAALKAGVIPLRYLRNIGTLGIDGQLRLLLSCIGVCGLGGLGGYVVEFLARMGTGRLILADGDLFEESNLNRQNLCTETNLGRHKADTAAERVSTINSSLAVTAHCRSIGGEDVLDVFGDACLVIDALDTVSHRLALEEGCGRLSIPLVHGAIAGDSGQVMTIFPGDPGLKHLYGAGEDRGVETIEGNPSTTPALVASIQASEAVKIICGGDLLRNGFLLIDTSVNLYQFIPLE